MKKSGKIAIVFLWGLVGIGLIVFVGFIGDKEKIQQENQNYLTMDQAIGGAKSFLDSSQKIVSNSPIKLP